MEDIIKKHKEYQVLKRIYTSNKIRIQSSERPDFIIESKKEKFGVEITEYYYNETSARLKNYKGYAEKILKSNSIDIIDQRDKEVIKKGRFIREDSRGK